MRERVASLGGQLTFESRAGLGAVLRVVIPVAATARAGSEQRLVAQNLSEQNVSEQNLPKTECAA